MPKPPDQDDDRPDGDATDRPQDSFVERRRPDPSQPPTPVLVLEGLLGDSDRAGFRRLYFTRELDHYAEFRAEDVVDLQAIPADQPPFLGEEATRVALRRDATIEYTRAHAARPLDEFDLDVRLGAPGAPRPGPFTLPLDCATYLTCRRTCLFETCDTCWPTCDTCRTRCGDVTCQATCNTCQTRCGQDTCDTCRTQCGQVTCGRTCDTCMTRCGQDTCDTCRTRCGTCDTCETCVTCVTCDTCGIACTQVGCTRLGCTQDTCGIACTAGGCITQDTCGIACTADGCVTMDTCSPRCRTIAC